MHKNMISYGVQFKSCADEVECHGLHILSNNKHSQNNFPLVFYECVLYVFAF